MKLPGLSKMVIQTLVCVVLAVLLIVLSATTNWTFGQFYYDGPPSRCIPRKDLIIELRRIGEREAGIGIRIPTGITELWVNDDPEKPTWSILITRSTGESCLVGHGTQWLIPSHKHKDGKPDYKPFGEDLSHETE